MLVKEGEYSYVDKDTGKVYNTKWMADEGGFRAAGMWNKAQYLNDLTVNFSQLIYLDHVLINLE